MLWLFLAVIGKLKWVRRRAPSISPIRGSARLPLIAGFFDDLLDFWFLSFSSLTGRTSRTSQRTESPTSRTSLTSPRTKAEHSPLWGRWRGFPYSWFFAPFVKIRGLNSVKNLLTFILSQTPQNPPRKGYQLSTDRIRALNPWLFTIDSTSLRALFPAFLALLSWRNSSFK